MIERILSVAACSGALDLLKPHDGRTGFKNNGEDLRIKGNAPAYAGTGRRGKDQYACTLQVFRAPE